MRDPKAGAILQESLTGRQYLQIRSPKLLVRYSVLSVLGLFLACGQVFARPPAAGEKVYPGAGESVWWVFLDRRDTSAEAWLRAERGLSEKAKARREAARGTAIVASDLPPHPEDLELIRNAGAQIRVVSSLLGAVSVIATEQEIETIETFPHVKKVRLTTQRGGVGDAFDIGLGLRQQSTPATVDTGLYGGSFQQLETLRVPELHAEGINGEGMVIGFLDAGYTGYDTHNAYKWLQVDSLWNFVDDNDNISTHTHGSTVMAMAVANDTGHMMGVSPLASVCLARTEIGSSETPIEEDYWVEGLEWLEECGVDVVSSSLAYSQWTDASSGYELSQMDGNTAVTTVAADAVAERGLLVVNSSGNLDSVLTPYLPAPADGNNVLAVGGCTVPGTGLYPNSLGGPTIDGRTKPDVVAPGVNPYRPDVTAGETVYYPSGYGTSYSCPFVAGIVVLMLQVDPELQPAEIIDILHATSRRLDGKQGPDNDWGWGVPDAVAAVGMVRELMEVADPSFAKLPENFSLGRLYPNPTNGASVLVVSLPVAAEVQVELVNLLGQTISERSQRLAAGSTSLPVSMDGLASGIYLVKVSAGGQTLVRRIALVR